jgi:ABC-type branched-subunit amino acid transport system ATPase component/branched-subunit amino acid ABC-type transport system permease component
VTDFLQFLLLGLGTGSLAALLGLGLVVIYRGSGTINFAHGSFALLGAYLVYELNTQHGWPLRLSMLVACLCVGILGVLVQLLLLAPLSGKSALVRVIATLGVLTVVQQAVTIRYGSTQVLVSAPLPQEPVTLGAITVGGYAFWLLGVAAVVTTVLTWTARRTKTGLAISAAAENQRAAAALGLSPNLLACISWGGGSFLAGLAGVLFASVSSGFLSIGGLSLVIVSGLAAALLGGFRSYPLVLTGGLLVGVTQSTFQNPQVVSRIEAHLSTTGLADAVPFLFIVGVLVVQGRGLPVRGALAERLPRIGNGRVNLPALLAITSGFALFVTQASNASWNVALVNCLCVAIVALSVVVVTGLAGQLSLAQFALAGIGGWAAGRLVAGHGWTFLPALLAGVVVAVVVGVVFGLPALRARGVNLAVITFGLGFATWSVVFNNTDYTGKAAGTIVKPQELFGISIDPNARSGTYATMCGLTFAACVVLIGNLRRGRSGRRMLAVRANERAAASLGISVVGAKLYAFGLAAGIAGLGGVLLTFTLGSVSYSTTFDPFTSVTVMTFAVIGGIGYLMGPLWGSLLAVSGILSYAVSQAFSDVSRWQPLVGGILLLLTLLVAPDGLAAKTNEVVATLTSARRRTPRRASNDPSPAKVATRVQPLTLKVSGVSVAFGGIHALTDVSLEVNPGEVVGLLGSNGAGKTTLIDVVTGYTQPQTGQVLLQGADAMDVTSWKPHRRARAGLSRSFQALELFGDLSVRENMLAACERRDSLAYVRDLFRPGKAALSPLASAAVEEMELGELLDTGIDDLSFGQRRLVAIARSVAVGGSLLLLDEPGAGLDEHETAELGVLVRRLADEWGLGVLLIEHDVAMVLRAADRVVVLDAGRVIACGTPEQVRVDPKVIDAYLGTRTGTDESSEALPSTAAAN